MKRFSLRSLFATAVLASGLCGSAGAQQSGTLASYVVNLGGFNVAYLDIRLDTQGASYQLDLSATVAGLAQIVAQGSGAVNSGGVITNAGLASNSFYLETRTQTERFSVQTSYSGGNATPGTVSPALPENPDRVPVTGGHRSGVNDPLAAFILRGESLGPQLCNRTMQIYTGIERFDMALSFADMQEATSPRTGYQGPVVLCAMRYVPISGHFTTSAITNYLKDNQRMLAWFAPLGDTGFYIPYRMIIGTSFGDLSMVLTALQ